MDYTIQKTDQVQSSSNNLLYIKGILAVVWGIAALIGAFLIPSLLVITFGILNFIAAFLTLKFAFDKRHLQIAHQWLLLEGIVELIAGITFTFIVTDLYQFITYMSYGIIFIIILQFIYGFTLILMEKFKATNMLMRFITVLAGTIIATALMAHVFTPGVSLIVVGAFSVLYGVINMQFATKLKNVIMGPVE